MPNILCYSRNKCTRVEQIDEKTIRSFCRIQDTFMDAHVEIMVKVPDLEIIWVDGKMSRSLWNGEINVAESLRKVIGTRVVPGIKRIIKGLVGESEKEKRLVFMMEECCNGVILSFTKDVLMNAPKDKSKEKEYFANMVRGNPRLYNSCAALAPGSPLVEGIEPP